MSFKNGKFIYVNTLSFRTVDDGENKDDQIYCVTKKMNEFEIIIFKIFLVVQEITKKIKFIKLKLLS